MLRLTSAELSIFMARPLRRTEKAHATVSRCSIELGIGTWPLGVGLAKRCPPAIRWSYGAAYGVRNPVVRPPGVAPPHDGYTPGSNHRLLRSQFIRDQVNIKWRGHQ
ncbi:hypothetical protein KC320_g7757 [Hortaea werneckii]|nr:hypothetical protein KC320_g7757 [Hortaea werneckii]